MKLTKIRQINILDNRRSTISIKEIKKFKKEAQSCKIKSGRIFAGYSIFHVASIGADSMKKNNFSISRSIEQAETKSKLISKRLII